MELNAYHKFTKYQQIATRVHCKVFMVGKIQLWILLLWGPLSEA